MWKMACAHDGLSREAIIFESFDTLWLVSFNKFLVVWESDII